MENENTKATIAKKGSFVVEVEEGKKYFWCACGLSQKQPFCDGSHKGSSFTPKKVVIKETRTVALCNCKHSVNGPMCDGSHSSLA